MEPRVPPDDPLRAAGLRQALTEHWAAIHAFTAAARHLPLSAWVTPAVAGKWSPAQLTEHVALAIELFTDELAGRPGMVPRLSGWKRVILRATIMPGLLRSGRFPPGVRTPRQLRPSPHPVGQAEGIRRLEDAAAALDATATALPEIARRKVTHPYFGRVKAPVGIRLLTLHARHHLSQLPHRGPA